MEPVLLALGANLGNRAMRLRTAIDGLPPAVRVSKISPIYETEPVHITDQPLFLNGVVAGETNLSPYALLTALQALEARGGRVKRERWGPREIDIDIVAFGDLHIAQRELTIPHPRFRARGFVLKPLADIAPDWRDPDTGETVAALLAALAPSDVPGHGAPLETWESQDG